MAARKKAGRRGEGDSTAGQIRALLAEGKQYPPGSLILGMPGRVVKDAFEKTPRNAPCPCGSGKKFKHCHGALAGQG